MRRRNNRRSVYKDDMDANKIILISGIVLIISILTFFITFFVYRNHLNKQAEIAKTKVLEIASIKDDMNEKSHETSIGIGKRVNEIKEDDKIETNKEENLNIQKIAINTSSMVKENITSENIQKEEEKNNESKNETKDKNIIDKNIVAINKEEKDVEPKFIKPVEGDIVVGFAKDTLIYSNTLQEWITHNGIDIKAEKTAIVKAAEEGTVKSIKNDPRYGITVVIEHLKGFKTVYSNLLTAEFIKEGEKLKKGQTIGTVGNTATFEIVDEPHLHFEIIKNDEYVNPELYLK